MASKQNKRACIVEGQGRIIPSSVVNARGQPVVHQMSYVSPNPTPVSQQPLRALSPNANRQLINKLAGPAQEQQDSESTQEPLIKRRSAPPSNNDDNTPNPPNNNDNTPNSSQENEKSEDFRYDPEFVVDKKAPIVMAEKGQFDQYPPLLKEFLEMGPQNAIPLLVPDFDRVVSRIMADDSVADRYLSSLDTKLENIKLHREKNEELYKTQYGNGTVGDIATALKDYYNYLLQKAANPDGNQNPPALLASAGSMYADVIKEEALGYEMAEAAAKHLPTRLDVLEGTEPLGYWPPLYTPKDQDNNPTSLALEIFRKKGEENVPDRFAVYEEIVEDPLIHNLPATINYLLAKIGNKRKKPIFYEKLNYKDDINQLKHYVNNALEEINDTLAGSQSNVKKEAAMKTVFNLYPMINELISTHKGVDPGDLRFAHPSFTWPEVQKRLPKDAKQEEKDAVADAVNIVETMTRANDLAGHLENIVNKESQIITHKNKFSVDPVSGLFITGVVREELFDFPEIFEALAQYNKGKIGTKDTDTPYQKFKELFEKYFPPTEANTPTQSEENESAPGEQTGEIPQPPKMTDDNLGEEKFNYRREIADASSFEPSRELGESAQFSSGTSESLLWDHADKLTTEQQEKWRKIGEENGFLLVPFSKATLPPRPATTERPEESQSEIPLADIYDQSPELGGQVELLKNNQSQLEGLLARFLESRGEVLNTGDTNLMTQLENLFTKNQDELTAVNVELLAVRQRDAEREASKSILENTLTQLNTKIQSLEQELNNVRIGEYNQTNELANLQAGMTALEQEKGRLERSLVNREETILKQAKDNAFLKGEIQRQAMNLGQSDHRYRALEEALKEAQQNAQEAENRYTENLNKTSVTIDRLQKELDLKTRQLSETRGANNHNAALENEIINLQERLSNANNKIAELEQGIGTASSVSVNAAALHNEINQFRSVVQNARTENITKGNLFTEFIDQNLNRIIPLVNKLHEEKELYHKAATHFQKGYTNREREIKRVVELYKNEQQKANQYREEIHRLQNTVSIAERRADHFGAHLLEKQQKTPIFKPSRSPSAASQGEVLTETQVLENETLGRLQKELEDAKSNIKELMDLTVKQNAELLVTRAAHADMEQQFNTMLEDNKRLKEVDEENKKLKSEVQNLDTIWKTSVQHEQDVKKNVVAELEQIIENTKRERDEIQARLEAENEGLADIARRRDNEITELRERLEAYNRRSARVQFDLANAVRENSVEKLKRRSKSFSSLDDVKWDAKMKYATHMHDLKTKERQQIHDLAMEEFRAKAEQRTQKEAFDRTHDAYKTIFMAEKDLAKTNMTHAQQINKLGLGASLYKDRKQYDASLNIALQGIEGDQAVRAKAIKNHEAGKLIAKLADSDNDGLRALGASMFANLLHDMTTMTDDELKATNYADLIKMNENGSIDKIIAALSTPRHAVDDSLAKRISDLENTTRSFINMMSQRTAHVGTAQAYHPPRRVFMGRGPAGVGKSNVRAPRKGRAKSRPVRKPKRGGRRSKK